MLSRVADSLYWMSRYYERADHAARVLDANYNLMLNPSQTTLEKRWHRIADSLGVPTEPQSSQSETIRAIASGKDRNSIVGSIMSARENASQIREQISSEMWERLNQIYHEVTRTEVAADPVLESEVHPMRLVTMVREGSYRLYGVMDATMSHGEGWYFSLFGRYMERVCAISRLVDAHFTDPTVAEDLDWVALLNSCVAFEAYCKEYTADLKPERVAEFLLLNAEFPYTVRHATDGMRKTLQAISQSSPARRSPKLERRIGQLSASLAYAEIDEIFRHDMHEYLSNVIEQCHELHSEVHDLYIDYPIAEALEA